MCARVVCVGTYVHTCSYMYLEVELNLHLTLPTELKLDYTPVMPTACVLCSIELCHDYGVAIT